MIIFGLVKINHNGLDICHNANTFVYIKKKDKYVILILKYVANLDNANNNMVLQFAKSQ
jgi:hypothetical protein